MANTEYSKIIVPCAGKTFGDPVSEPGPYGWDLSATMQDGRATIVKIYNFKLSSYAVSQGIQPCQVCPDEVMKAEGFPVKYSLLSAGSRYKYYGNGTIEHPDQDLPYWQYRAEYTIQNSSSGSLNSDGRADDENTPPWKRRPTNVSISFPEVVVPFRMAYNSKNNRFNTESDGSVVTLVPVVNTAGDIIEAETKRHYVQLSFTYCLNPTDFNIHSFIANVNSINQKVETVCGLKFPARSCLIASLDPQYHDEQTDGSGRKSWKWWEISAVLQYDPSGDEFEQRLLNIGNRARWPKRYSVSAAGEVSWGSLSDLEPVPMPIYHWRTFHSTDHGQNGASEYIQFGHYTAMMAAKAAFDRKFRGRGWTFAYDEDSQMPLAKNGTLDTGVLNPSSSRYQKYRTLGFQEHKRKDWAGMKFPKKGVDW